MSPQSTSKPLTQRPAWRALAAHHKKIARRHLRDLFAADPKRGEKLTAEAAGLHHAHFAFEFRLGDRRPEPPPAHHDFGVVGRGAEGSGEGADIGRGRQGEQGQREKVTQGLFHVGVMLV